MPQQIEVPGLGIVEFPDGMSDADIVAAIKANPIRAQSADGVIHEFPVGTDPRVIDRVIAMDREVQPTAHREAYGTFPSATDAHTANFIECCRTRRTPNAPAEAGHHANVVLCMAMQSLRVGRRVRFDPEKRTVEG